MNSDIKGPIIQMLKALAYWLAYKREIQDYHVIESDAVAEAYQILSTKLITEWFQGKKRGSL